MAINKAPLRVEQLLTQKKRYTGQRMSASSISIPTADDQTLVVCPGCAKMAKVFLLQVQPEVGYAVKLSCIHCGYSKNIGDQPAYLLLACRQPY